MAGFLKKNEGNVDRAIRVVLGVGLLALPFAAPDLSWNVVGYLGVVPLVTGLVGTCPIYMLLGISTCPVDTKTA